jgi:hypothetical protein
MRKPPTIAGAGGAGAAIIGQGASMLEIKLPDFLGPILFYGGLAVAIGYVGWWAIYYWRRFGLEPPVLVIAVGLLIAIGGTAWLMLRPQPSSRPQVANFEFVRNQHVDAQEGPQTAAMYRAQFARSGTGRLRVFLEYGGLGADLEKSTPARVTLHEFRDYVAGDPIELLLVSQLPPSASGEDQFSWGDRSSGKPLPIGNYQARIVVMDDAGNQQRFYFAMMIGIRNGRPYPAPIPAEAEDGSPSFKHISQWDHR